MDELRNMHGQFMELYATIKREVRRRNLTQYERWKAGGFLIDDDIISMYPSLDDVVDLVEVYEDEDEEDEVDD